MLNAKQNLGPECKGSMNNETEPVLLSQTIGSRIFLSIFRNP